ncbi:MAG: hypothetical protein A3D92_00705 [Bacteroidetes bacterium RIFCSPHIGHO2_02_FULL_44_7]|nr:MAG: hypothetical protein A3D92_00705 [Bacteroidetes bacterium RIFCSPHIGHO2_02_FULL_44_7]
MKDYKQVVKERFDRENMDQPSIYAPDQPIGIYSRKILFRALHEMLEAAILPKGPLDTLRLLDVGCGNGEMLEFMMNEGFSQEHLAGVDFSSVRIEKAKGKFPNIHFDVADITLPLPFNEVFDVVTAFDLFSHLSNEKQLLAGLKSVSDVLPMDGLFLWYDIAALDHFGSPHGADSWGFSKAQMIDLANRSGFEVVHYKGIFRNFFNRYHSLYQAKRVSHSVLRVLEKLLPGRPGNHIFVFVKRS